MFVRLSHAVLLIGVVTAPAFGQFWEKPGGPFSGSVQAIYVLDDGTVLAGTPRGLFVRGPGAQEWMKSESPPAAVHDLISVDEILYTATHGGVYSSADGIDWSPAGLQELRVLSLLKHSGGALLAGTFRNGVFKRARGDMAWVAGNSGFPHFYGRPESYYPARSLAEGAGGVIFAGTGTDELAALGGGLHKSEDGGQSWQVGGSISVGDIGSVLADADGRIMVAGFRTYWHLLPGIVLSEDNGSTWIRTSGIDASHRRTASESFLRIRIRSAQKRMSSSSWRRQGR